MSRQLFGRTEVRERSVLWQPVAVPPTLLFPATGALRRLQLRLGGNAVWVKVQLSDATHWQRTVPTLTMGE